MREEEEQRKAEERRKEQERLDYELALRLAAADNESLLPPEEFAGFNADASIGTEQSGTLKRSGAILKVYPNFLFPLTFLPGFLKFEKLLIKLKVN